MLLGAADGPPVTERFDRLLITQGSETWSRARAAARDVALRLGAWLQRRPDAPPEEAQFAAWNEIFACLWRDGRAHPDSETLGWEALVLRLVTFVHALSERARAKQQAPLLFRKGERRDFAPPDVMARLDGVLDELVDQELVRPPLQDLLPEGPR